MQVQSCVGLFFNKCYFNYLFLKSRLKSKYYVLQVYHIPGSPLFCKSYFSNIVAFTPDGNGQTESLSLNGKTIASFKLNANGLLTSTILGNGASIANDYIGNETLLKSQTFNRNSTTTWDTLTYNYDANNQIKEVKSNAGTVTYAYDALNQLKQEQYTNGLTIGYTYDLGNRTSKSITQNGKTTKTDYGYNDENQMTDASAQSIAVDVNGNVTNDGRYAYVWNASDQLTEVKTLSGSILKTYRYDENGRRVYSKDSNGETYYRYNGLSNQVLFEKDASGVITKSYTYDDNGLPLTMTYRDKTYYYLTNYRGDVLALTDESGTIVAEYTYDAWGNILTQKDLDEKAKVNLAKVNPYRYAGYRYDEETKLYYLMARYYNPDMGVFLSLDPARGDTSNPITMNGYNYANNNPVMFVDPDGEWAVVVGAVVGALINAIIYYVGLINKHGLKNAHKHIKLGAITSTILLGAASGALGFGVVKVLAQKGALTAIGERLLSLHIAPAAYAIGNFGSYNAKGVTENQVLSQFGKRTNVIYQVFKPILQKVISKYKRR